MRHRSQFFAICERCGNPISGQSISQNPGPGPMHPECWNKHKSEELEDVEDIDLDPVIDQT